MHNGDSLNRNWFQKSCYLAKCLKLRLSHYFYLMRNSNFREMYFHGAADLGSMTAFWLVACCVSASVLMRLVRMLHRWISKWLEWISAVPAMWWALASPPAQQQDGLEAPLVRLWAHNCGNESWDGSLTQNSHLTHSLFQCVYFRCSFHVHTHFLFPQLFRLRI